MAVAKVILNGTTLIDTTGVTVASDKLLSDYTALKNDGTTVVGTVVPLNPSGTVSITNNGIYDVRSFASADVNVSGGGGDESIINSIFDKTISGTYVNQSGVSVAGYAFESCTALEAIEFRSCETIGQSAFHGCTSLMSAFFPSCEIIGQWAFYNCNSLVSVSFPACTLVGSYAFSGCSLLASISLPSCITISNNAFGTLDSLSIVYAPLCETVGSYAFGACRSLAYADFPACTSIGTSAFATCSGMSYVSFPVFSGTIGSSIFRNCSQMVSVYFPLATQAGAYAFQSCWSLSSIVMPMCRYIGQYTFVSCSALSSVSFPNCSNFGQYAFGYCSRLEYVVLSHPNQTSGTIPANTFASCSRLLSLYLLASTMYTLGAVTAFANTPISNRTTETGGVRGSVFVKASLYNEYVSATNWVTYSARIVSISDSDIAALFES